MVDIGINVNFLNSGENPYQLRKWKILHTTDSENPLPAPFPMVIYLIVMDSTTSGLSNTRIYPSALEFPVQISHIRWWRESAFLSKNIHFYASDVMSISIYIFDLQVTRAKSEKRNTNTFIMAMTTNQLRAHTMLCHYYIMKRKFKQWWSTILRKTTFHLKPLNVKTTATYGVENLGHGLGQAQQSRGVKPVNGILTLPIWSLY